MSRQGRTLPLGEAVVAIAGLGIAAYLTALHVRGGRPVCSTSGLIDCERVLSSSYGVVLGSMVPTAALGLVWFAISLALALVQLWAPDKMGLAWIYGAWAAAGLASVLGLVFIEIVRIGALCAWCTSAHALVLATFLLALVRLQAVPEGVQ